MDPLAEGPGHVFTRITLAQLLALIRLTNGGLKQIDIVDLLVSLTQLWEQDPRVPEYLRALEESQKNLVCVTLAFSDDLLVTIATSSLLNTNSSPNDQPKWDGKLPAEQTLKSWRKLFLPLHQSIER